MFFSLLREANTCSRFPSLIRQIAGLPLFIAALGVCSSGFGQTADERFIAKKLFHGAWDLKAKGNPIAAIVLFEGGLKLVPQDATAHFHLATIYEAAGDTPSAIQHFSEVIRLAPQSKEAVMAKTRTSNMHHGIAMKCKEIADRAVPSANQESTIHMWKACISYCGYKAMNSVVYLRLYEKSQQDAKRLCGNGADPNCNEVSLTTCAG